MDIVISAAWFAAFGLLVNALGRNGCGNGAFNWGGITQGGVCNRWRVSSLLRCVIRDGRELVESLTSFLDLLSHPLAWPIIANYMTYLGQRSIQLHRRSLLAPQRHGWYLVREQNQKG